MKQSPSWHSSIDVWFAMDEAIYFRFKRRANAFAPFYAAGSLSCVQIDALIVNFDRAKASVLSRGGAAGFCVGDVDEL